MSTADIIPSSQSQLRACLLCSLIKTHEQFETYGCDNCEHLLNMADDNGKVHQYTSASFEGMIAMMQPTESWVARWKRLTKFKPGIYALAVHGELPRNVANSLREHGIKYTPRDQ